MITSNDTFIKNTADVLGMSEATVHKIVAYQWAAAKAATLTGSIIEITGLGRFQVRMTKVERAKVVFNRFLASAVKTLESLDKETDEQWYSAYKKVKGLEKDMEFLNMKRENQTKLKADEPEEHS